MALFRRPNDDGVKRFESELRLRTYHLDKCANRAALGSLPSGCMTSTRRIYFLDHNTRTST